MDATRPKTAAPTTGSPSAERFVDYLLDVLRRDRKLAKSKQKNYRDLAQRLASVLWNGAVSARDRRGEYDRQVWRETARAQAHQADDLAGHARQLLEYLHQAEPLIREAIDRGFLPRGAAPGPAPSNLADLMAWGTEWPAAAQIRQPVEQLAHEATEWASQARREGKRSRGPQRSRTRDQLSAWVAVQLAQAGVWPRTTRAGPFARVLSTVQVIAGFPKRSLEQIERDVLRALKHPWVVEHLSQLQKPPHNSPSKKVRIS